MPCREGVGFTSPQCMSAKSIPGVQGFFGEICTLLRRHLSHSNLRLSVKLNDAFILL